MKGGCVCRREGVFAECVWKFVEWAVCVGDEW